MKESGYKQSQGDHTLFIKHSAEGGNCSSSLCRWHHIDWKWWEGEAWVEAKISKRIWDKRTWEIEVGIEVAYSQQRIFISQQKYVTDLFVEAGKVGCNLVSTPMDPNHKLREAKKEPTVDKRMYQRLVGRLIYLAHTRSDIAYFVSLISQFMYDPRESHLQGSSCL